MNYTIDIIDTQNNELVLSVEKAIASSVILSWQGNDRKDELNIVGSSLKFTMAADSREDGVYYDLFTGDETRYRVRLYDDNNTTIWSGFILPDEYSEPYSNKPILVDFEAVDGLGRLKGKFLPDDYYKEEKSVIDIIARCLELTGVDMNFRFAPAIENSTQKDYNKIYYNTSKFDTDDDAYTILEVLLESMLCTIYQADDYWNIEGINIREQRVYTAKIYDYTATLLEEVEITRLKKDITGINKPEISMQTPYGIIDISHKKEVLEVNSEGVTSETNDGWSYVTEGVITPESSQTDESDSLIFASGWYGNRYFQAYSGKDNDVFFAQGTGSVNEQINLRQDIYLQQGRKYKLTLKFSITPYEDDGEINQGHVDNGDWKNPFDYSVGIRYGADMLELYPILTNFGIEDDPAYFAVNFSVDSKEVEIEWYFIHELSGDLYISMFPVKQDNGIEYVNIEELNVELLGQLENDRVKEVVTEDWTTKKVLELEIADDNTALSKGFQLEKFKSDDFLRNEDQLIIPINRNFSYKRTPYITVPLWGANLIDENRDSVFTTFDDSNIEIVDVHYNFKNSDEHAIQLKTPFSETGDLYVIDRFYRLYKDRQAWTEWTDTIYQVERNGYVRTAFNIFSRMFDKEVPTFPNITLKNNVKFNDIIGFDWKNAKDWVVTNCKWDIDKGFTDVTVAEKYYITSGKYPPVVEAGNAYYTDDSREVLAAQAHDPDGFITSYYWEETSNTGALITRPNNAQTTVELQDGVFVATFRVTVTDNDGNTASDEVSVYRRNDVEITLEEIYSDLTEKKFKLVVTPEIPLNTSLSISGKLSGRLEWNTVNDRGVIYTTSELEQDNHIISRVVNSKNIPSGDTGIRYNFSNFRIFYKEGDEVIFTLSAPNTLQTAVQTAKVVLNTASYSDGYGSAQIIDEIAEFEQVSV